MTGDRNESEISSFHFILNTIRFAWECAYHGLNRLFCLSSACNALKNVWLFFDGEKWDKHLELKILNCTCQISNVLYSSLPTGVKTCSRFCTFNSFSFLNIHKYLQLGKYGGGGNFSVTYSIACWKKISNVSCQDIFALSFFFIKH